MLTRADYIKVFILRFLGYFLIQTALAGLLLTFAPALSAEALYRLDGLLGKRFTLEDDLPELKVENKADEPKSKFLPPLVGISPINRDFAIVIPKINANSGVIADVDAGNESVYMPALKRGVAHAVGSTYPGQLGNTFLFAHSAGNFWEVGQYNAVFFLLKELDLGDEVDIFYGGKRYYYKVVEKKIVEPDRVDYINNQPGNSSQLTLQTCWPPGTTLRRLLVIAKLVDHS